MILKIERLAWQKIQAYVSNCKYEIGGLGQVVCDGENFLVTDAEIFTQKVTPAHVDMTAETLALFQLEKARAKQTLVNYKFWWHSHAAMGVFFSGTDTDTIDQSGGEFPWLVSFVTNHKHEMLARLDVYKPVHLTTTLEIEIVDELNAEIVAQCLADIAAKVTTPAPVYTQNPHAWRSAYQGGVGGYFGKEDALPSKKATKKTEKKLQKELDRLERLLAHLEGQGETVEIFAKIDETEAAIAAVSIELDAVQGLTLPVPVTPVLKPAGGMFSAYLN